MTSKCLKVILVTSQVTYIPGNYLGLLETLLKDSSHLISGVIFLKNLDVQLAKTILGLRYLGAKKVQQSVLKNISALPLKRREKLISSYGIPIRNFGSMNAPDALNWCRSKDPDLIVNARTRCIYKTPILKVPKLGCINVHHGILPEYRGTMCDLYALSEGRSAGFSIHHMNEKIDDGRVFVTKESSDGSHNDYLGYLAHSAKIEGAELSRFLNDVAENQILPKGVENKSKKIVFSRNPTRNKVQELLERGMIL